MEKRPDPSFAARAAARASWSIRRYELGKEPDEDLRATTTAAERLAMMWPLALDAWSVSGRSLPDYPRSETPIRVIRPTSTPKGEPS